MNTTNTRHALIGAALSHLALERMAAAVIEVPDTEPQLFIAIGTAAEIGKLLPEIRQLVQRPGYITAAQIAAGAAVKCDHGWAIGRNVAIDVFDAMNAAADSTALTTGGAGSAVRALLLELTTFDAKLVDGGHLAQRAAAILAMPQEGGAP